MPTFIGTLTLNQNQEVSTAMIPTAVKAKGLQEADAAVDAPAKGKKLETGLSIVLENVTAGFKKPNVIDLKLGARLWSDDAPEKKRRRLDEVSNTTTSCSLGFRIAGMGVHKAEKKPKPAMGFKEHTEVENDSYLSYDKSYGRGLSAENVHEAFVEFFDGWETLKKPGGTRHVAKRLAREVRNLAYVMEKEESRMYSASILMVYEGDEGAMKLALDEEERRKLTTAAGSRDGNEPDGEGPDDDSEEDDDDPKPKLCDMRVIDFAHAAWTPGQGHDENALRGVRSVLKILEQLAAENGG